MIDHDIIKVSHGDTYRDKTGKLTGIRNGAPLTIHTLKEMLDYQATLRGGEKKSFGGIYPFEDTVKREKSTCDLTYKSSHVMFFDIDSLPDEETKKKIFNSFDEIIKLMPNIYAMCFSNSGNLHVFAFIQERYNYEEYFIVEAAMLCCLCKVIEEVCGIVLYPGAANRKEDEDAISAAYGRPYAELPHNLDTHNANMFQQIYLAASPWPEMGYKLNEYCSPLILTEESMIKAFEYYHYPTLIRQCKSYYHPHGEDVIDKKVRSTGYKVSGMEASKIYVDGEIDHEVRWQMRNMLAYSMGVDRGDKVFMQILESYDEMRIRKGMERKRDVKTMFDMADGGRKDLRIDKRSGKPYCNHKTRQVMKELGFVFDVSSPEDPYVSGVDAKTSTNILGRDDFLTSRIDYVMEQIEKHQVNLIKAPTGAGKTELIKDISHRTNVAIATPFRSMGTGIYGVKQDGSPVEPVDNVICSRLVDNSIDDWIENGGSLVGVWDQMVGVFQRLIAGNYLMVVDESHTLCPGTSYRAKAIRFGILLNQYIRMGGKVVFVTATPTLEEMEFPDVTINRIDFDKVCRKRKVDVYYNLINKLPKKKNEDNDKLRRGTAEWRMFGDIVRNYRRHAYDYVLVVSDLYNNILCEKLRAKGIKVHQLNNSNHEPEVVADMEKVNREHRLEKGVYVGTCYIENGFNINNEDGSALVIMDVQLGQFSYAKILQTIGRFRKLKNVAAKVYIEGIVNGATREDGMEIAIPESNRMTPMEKQIKAEAVATSGLEMGYDEDMLIGADTTRYKVDGFEYTRKAFEEYIRMKYEQVHGQPEQLQKDLESNNMVVDMHDMINEDVVNICCRPVRKEKKEMEARAWEMMMGREEYDDDYMRLRYPNELNVMYKRLCNLYGKDIVVSFADKLLEASPENNRSTILQSLEDNLPWSFHNDEWCGNQKRIMQKVIDRLVASADDINKQNGVYYDVSLICKEIKSTIDGRIRWREKYGEVKDVNVDIPRIESIMEDDIAMGFLTRSDAHKVTHKPHKQKRYRCEDGFEGTKNELVAHTGKGLSTIERWITSGKVEKIG